MFRKIEDNSISLDFSISGLRFEANLTAGTALSGGVVQQKTDVQPRTTNFRFCHS
ncbi:hypothetical protein BV349_04749 [Pseudomonas syringae pv. actinidiae]|nr:hypothetical protein BV349_04749 [Pseudomonas syringae pv. actinidiae]OSN72107.1 hypothetical protein BV351_04767 [Pseudomonas syringae pv. actinidiae]RMS19468.1 hypothetical protein ALP75_202873 [Pseudomonas syringae pv. actinidiae]